MATTIYISDEEQNDILKRVYPGETIPQYIKIAVKSYNKKRDLEQVNVK